MKNDSFEEKYKNIRINVINLITNKLSNKSKKIAEDLEKTAYNDAIRHTSFDEIKSQKNNSFKLRYNYRLEQILKNIGEFEKRLNDKSMVASDIFNKKPYELFPIEWEDVIQRKREEDKGVKIVSNSAIHCYKCNEKNVYVINKQTRSADEPETIYYNCLSCYNKWVS